MQQLSRKTVSCAVFMSASPSFFWCLFIIVTRLSPSFNLGGSVPEEYKWTSHGWPTQGDIKLDLNYWLRSKLDYCCERSSVICGVLPIDVRLACVPSICIRTGCYLGYIWPSYCQEVAFAQRPNDYLSDVRLQIWRDRFNLLVMYCTTDLVRSPFARITALNGVCFSPTMDHKKCWKVWLQGGVWNWHLPPPPFVLRVMWCLSNEWLLPSHTLPEQSAAFCSAKHLSEERKTWSSHLLTYMSVVVFIQCDNLDDGKQR